MAEPQVSWADGLSPSLRGAFEWALAASGARAKEQTEVGTAALLVGIVRSHEGYSEPEVLVQHFGGTREQLFDALVATAREQGPERPVDLAPTVQRRARLKEFPPLNPPVRQALGLASEVVTASDRRIHLPMMFGALLDLDGTHAHTALGRVLGSAVSLEAIRDSYHEWLAEGGRRLYPSFLAERYPGGRVPDPETPPPSGGTDPQGRPRYLVAVEVASGVRGTGIATRAGALTATSLLGDSREALLFADEGSVNAELFGSAAGAALLQPADGELPIAPSELAVPGAPPPPPQSTVTIWYSTFEGWKSATAGVVGPTDEGRLVRLSVGPDPALTGGAVLDDRGRLVGIVVTSGEDVTEAATERVLTAPPFAPESGIGTLGGAGNDQVAIEDSLGFDQYVEAFCELIASPYTQPPLTIGIYGAWGMGKSFLLKNIEARLRADAENGSGTEQAVHVVSFNAWEYSANEVIWPGLVRKTLGALEDRTSNGFTKLWRRLRRNAGRQLKVARGRIIAGLTILIAAGVAVFVQSRFSTAALIAVVGAVGIGGVVKFVSDALSDPLGQWFTALFEDRGYGAPIGYMEEIKHDLEDLQKNLKGDRILVVIDDLDRCEPDKAVEVLQAINLLLTFESFIVCLGIDARVITRAIERHYEDLLAESGASGYEYLEKIVQIPFRIPDPSDDDVMRFLLKQLGDPKPDGRHSESGEDGPEPVPGPGTATGREEAPAGGADSPPRTGPPAPAQHAHGQPKDDKVEPESTPPPVAFTWMEYRAFETLTPFLRHNPRRLKRLVNVYRLVRTLAAREGSTQVSRDPLATIRWLALADQWPYAASAMLRHFERLLDDWAADLSNAPAHDPLTYLMGEVKPALSREKRLALDDDADLLDELLECEDGRLSWEQLVAMRRYTVNFNPAIEEEMRAGLEQPEAPAETNGSQPKEAAPA